MRGKVGCEKGNMNAKGNWACCTHSGTYISEPYTFTCTHACIAWFPDSPGLITCSICNQNLETGKPWQQGYACTHPHTDTPHIHTQLTLLAFLTSSAMLASYPGCGLGTRLQQCLLNDTSSHFTLFTPSHLTSSHKFSFV